MLSLTPQILIRSDRLARIAAVSLRGLFRASAIYTIGNLAPKIGAFLLLPIYVRFLTQEEYGALALLTSLAGIMALLYHLGLDGALMRLHFDGSGSGRARLYSTATLFSMALGATLTVVLALTLAPFFEALFAGIPFVPLGLLTLLIAFVGSLQYIPSTLFRASGQPGAFLLVNLGAFLVSSALSIILVTIGGLGVAGVLTGQFVASSAVFIVTLVLIGRMGPWTFDRRQLREALVLGLPLLPHGVAAWALRLADRWLIALLIGLPATDARAQVGVYAVGYQLGFVVSIAITSFNSAWSPYFFRIGYRPSGPRFYTAMTTVVVGGLLILATGASVLAPEIVAVIARPGYEAAADVLPIIAFASVFQGFYVMFVTVVFLAKRTGRLAAITLTAAGINIALNVVLIPLLGINGAAWATLGAYLFFAATTYGYARGMFDLHVDWARIAAMISVSVAGVVAGRWLFPGPSISAGIAHLAIGLAVAAAITSLAWAPLQRLRDASRSLSAEA